MKWRGDEQPRNAAESPGERRFSQGAAHRPQREKQRQANQLARGCIAKGKHVFPMDAGFPACLSGCLTTPRQERENGENSPCFSTGPSLEPSQASSWSRKRDKHAKLAPFRHFFNKSRSRPRRERSRSRRRLPRSRRRLPRSRRRLPRSRRRLPRSRRRLPRSRRGAARDRRSFSRVWPVV